jgi:hypothetical protein
LRRKIFGARNTNFPVWAKKRAQRREMAPYFTKYIEGHNIEDKIHCTVSKLDETWLKYSLALYHYVKVQQLDDICEIRRQKANRRQNMAEIVFSWGVSEIKYIIFKENNDNSYEIHNNYVKLN